jgi:hypothetical protein
MIFFIDVVDNNTFVSLLVLAAGSCVCLCACVFAVMMDDGIIKFSRNDSTSQSHVIVPLVVEDVFVAAFLENPEMTLL